MPIGTRDVLVAVRARDVASRVIREIGANIGGLSGRMDDVNKKVQAQGRSWVNAGAAMTAAGVVMGAAGAAGIAALKGMADEAIEFQRQVAYARTQVDDLTISQEQLEKIVLRTGRTVPVAFEEMNEALFDIFSTVDVGAPAAEHLLSEFSKAAVAGQTDVRTAARATMALMNAYQVPVSEASNLLDMQFKLVQKGVGEYEDFANQLNKLIPLAASTGQEIETMFGLLTTMTRRTGDAATSATALARGMQAFTRTDAVENFRTMGIEIADANGNFRQMDDIIMDMMGKFESLGEVEFGAALKEAFGREGRIRMQNFFRIMREGIIDAQGRVDALGDSSGVMQEKFEQMADQPYAKLILFNNAMEEFRIVMGQQVIPLLTPAIERFTALLHRFSDLDPSVRRAIVLFAAVSSAALLIAGTLTTLAGVFIMVAGAAKYAGVSLGKLGMKIGIATAGFMAFITVATLLIFYWDETLAFLRGAWQGIVDGLNSLQRAFTQAMDNILQVVLAYGRAIYRALQWLNPFARHSPSLVEDVTAGVDTILSQYARLRGIAGILDRAREAVQQFHASIRTAQEAVDSAALAELEQYLSAAGSGAVAAYRAAQVAVERLEQQLISIDREYQNQYEALEDLQDAVDAANERVAAQEQVVEDAERAIEDHERALAALENTLRDTGVQLQNARDRFRELEQEVRRIEDAINDAERRMQEFARAPLEGTQEFQDQLFELDQEAARVRQQMLQWEAAGAPPEALDFFRLQLDEIARKAEALRLQEKLELDPLRKQLEQAANATRELTFEEAMAGIQAAKEEIAKLRDELPNATKEMLDQGKVVEQLEALYELQEASIEAARSVLQEYREGLQEAQEGLKNQQEAAEAANEAYLAQQEVLQGLEDSYRAVAQEIGNLRSEMESILQVAQQHWQAIEEAKQAAADTAVGGGGGAAAAGNEVLDSLAALEGGELPEFDAGALDDMLGEIDTSVLEEINVSLDELHDLGKKLAPVVAAVGAAFGAWGLWNVLSVLGKIAATILSMIFPGWALVGVWTAIWTAITGPIGLAVLAIGAVVAAFLYLWNNSEAFRNFWIGLWDSIKETASNAWQSLQDTWDAILRGVDTYLVNPAKALWKFMQTAWKGIVDAIETAWKSGIKPVWDLLYSVIQKTLVPIFELWLDVVETVWKGVSDAISFAWNIIRTIWDAIYAVIKGVLIPLMGWWLDVFQAVWNGVFEVLRDKWNQIKPIFEGVRWFVEEVLGPVFDWLAFTVIPAVWNAIKDKIEGVWVHTIKPIFEAVKWIIETVLFPVLDALRDKWTAIWEGMKSVLSSIWSGIKSVIASFINGIIDNIENFLNGIIGAVNAVGRAIEALPGDQNIREIGRIHLTRMSTGGATGGTSGGGAGGIQALQTGGDVMRSGVFQVHEDELMYLPRGTAVRNPARGQVGGNITVEEGAVQLIVQGSIDSATLPDVERMLQDTVDQLSDQLRSRFGDK